MHSKQHLVVEVAAGVLGGIADTTLLAGPYGVTLTQMPRSIVSP